MRKIVYLLLVALFAVDLSAASLPDKKIVVKTSGGETDYPVKSIKSIKFNDGTVVFNLVDGSSVEWSSDAVGCMLFDYYEPQPDTAVDAVVAADFSFSGGVLNVTASSAEVSLTTVEGKVVFNGQCRGNLAVQLSAFPKGVYLLNIDGCIYKIVNR